MKLSTMLIASILCISMTAHNKPDPIVSGGSFGGKCPAPRKDFFDDEITKAKDLASYLCFALSLEGASMGSMLDLCAGVRNDHNASEQEVTRFVEAIKGENKNPNSSPRFTLHTIPLQPIYEAIVRKLPLMVEKRSVYAQDRGILLDRLHDDLTSAFKSCGDFFKFEYNDVLRRYGWEGFTISPGPQTRERCRVELKQFRTDHKMAKLDPILNEAVELLEVTQRFVDRVRGLTLQPNRNHINTLDLHVMAKQAFDMLNKRVKFLLKNKDPQNPDFEKFVEEDPDFANVLACQFKKLKSAPTSPRIDQRMEAFKHEVLEKFVWPQVRHNKFAELDKQEIGKSALEEITYLIGSGYFQRAIWVYEMQTQKQDMREFFEKEVSGKRFMQVELAEYSGNNGMGRNESYMVTLPNGIRGIFKPFIFESNISPRQRENLRGEIAVNEIDKILYLGVVPVSVMISIDKREGSFQFFVHNALTPANMDISRGMQLGQGIARKSWEINLLDCLALNPDRQSNIGNMMVVVDGHKRVAIDNGDAFNGNKDFVNIELRYPKADSSAFIPPDKIRRNFLMPKLERLLEIVSSQLFVVHDDERLNKCGKLIMRTTIKTFLKMLKECQGPSNKECNAIGISENDRLMQEPHFKSEYENNNCRT